MSNLLPVSSANIAEKIRLYGLFDVTDYAEETSVDQATLTSFFTDCNNRLIEQLEEINGKLSSVDKTDASSIPLATEKNEANEFVMQPEDATAYMDSSLSFEYTITDSILSVPIVFPNSTIETSDAGNTITLSFSTSMENPDLPYPFKNVQIDLVIHMTYIATSRYDATDAEFTITYTDLYRGPLDDVDDRGSNYYGPITTTATYSEPVTGNPTTRYTNTGGLWSLSVSEAADGYTLDNGSSGVINFDFNFTTTSALTKFVGGEVVDSNITDADLNGALVMPKYQWSEFTTTQSPNTLIWIASLNTELSPAVTTLYSTFIENQIGTAWSESIDALPYGEYLDEDPIIAIVNAEIQKNSDYSLYVIIGKKYLGESTFYASATWALSELGIDITVTANTDLDAVNTELIAVGVTGFESSPGYYDWGVVPKCNSLDMCSRFATAVFDRIDTIDVVLTHSGVSYLSDNFDYIEIEITETNTALEEII